MRAKVQAGQCAWLHFKSGMNSMKKQCLCMQVPALQQSHQAARNAARQVRMAQSLLHVCKPEPIRSPASRIMQPRMLCGIAHVQQRRCGESLLHVCKPEPIMSSASRIMQPRMLCRVAHVQQRRCGE